MNTVQRVVLALCLSAAVAGCSKSNSTSTTPPASVGITASRRAIVANGVNSLTLTVTDTTGGPVEVSTSRGTFQGGGATATLTGTTSTVTLISCDATADAACAGNALVTAIHGAATASVSITFGALAAVCSADCAADAACPNHACVPTGGGTGTCSGTSPSSCVGAASCTPTETAETTCSDGVDNDCDGAVDCADTDCADRSCSTTSATSVCQSGRCVDVVSGLTVAVTPARTRLPANGTATTTIAVKVTSGTTAAPAMGITISTDVGAFGAGTSTTGTTGSDGVASFVYTAPATPGVATITASVTGAASTSRTATITMPALGQLRPGAIGHAVLGAKGSGFQESGSVSVQVLDDIGLPYPDGLAVRFEHHPLGGSALVGPAATCAAPTGCVASLGATSSGTDAPDSDGLATGWLASGTVAATLATTATATVAGVTRTIPLTTVAVVGVRASGDHFSVVCSPRNVPALADTTCSVSLVDAPFHCEALLADRYGNVLGTATQVIFMAETAAVGKVTSTPAWDGVAAAPAGLGTATQTFSTLGEGLPWNVDPQAGEPSVDLGAPDRCGVQVHNPRDGVVTVIAIADGEEAFVDQNGNGVYDAGEPFVDQGEPFVDANDNGQHDAFEWFLDVNGNGTYDGPNGVWDAATKIWTQAVVVYTGVPARLASGGGFVGTRWAAGGAACTPSPVPTFAVTAGAPPSSATFAVFASDGNLNRLAPATSYATTVRTGTVTVKYAGLASYADDLGFFYRYWPCDGAGTCSAVCHAAGANLPCVMRPALMDFSCGIGASATITGGAAADPGTDAVSFDVSTPYPIYGSNINALFSTWITGTSN